MALKKKTRKRVVALSEKVKEYPELSLDQALEIVVAGKRAEGVRDRTLRDYVKMFGYFREWLDENYEVSHVGELTAEMFRNYINYMKYDKPRYGGHKFITADQGVGLSDTTININLRALIALFNFLEREELIPVSPMRNIKLLRFDQNDLTNALTDDEVRRILAVPNLKEYVSFRDYVAINILLDCGLRAQELLSLRTANIDFQTRFIHIDADKSKNRKERMVPMSTHTSKLILRLITENNEHFRTDRLFLSSYGEPLGQNHFNKRLKYYAEKAGVTAKKRTAHVYRHTWAKNMVLEGCDAFTLQKLGGWSDIRTMRRYIQMDIKEMREKHDQFSPFVSNRYK
ncbi:site-specific integrase [Terribacillus sp. 179-K 1B1 HS]|uniref:tyrosine-type recombinase/integrase n=1 Tax=Terribacillus sp. 179-K 1B1 HS TaxID=3142388 RepID=UPI0039A14940